MPTPSRPRLKLLSLLFLLLLLPGCSSTTFIYNRLDFLLPWYLKDYMDLSRPQKAMLDELLTPYLQWHRAEELPIYLTLLEEVEQSLDESLEIGDVVAVMTGFEEAWTRLEQRSLDWILALGADLSAEQIEDFLAKLDEQQQEYEEEYLTRSDEEYQKEAYENLVDSCQDFLGRLDKSQKQVLSDSAAAMHRSDAAWLSERALWLTKLATLLQREPGWQQRLRDALAQREQGSSAEYRELFAHNVEQIQQAVVAVVNARSPKQDRRLRKKLDHFERDLETLIEQGRKKAA